MIWSTMSQCGNITTLIFSARFNLWLINPVFKVLGTMYVDMVDAEN